MELMDGCGPKHTVMMNLTTSANTVSKQTDYYTNYFNKI